MQSGDLDAIGLRTGTDKASCHHNFLTLYERFLEPFRNRPINFLEIGVFKGASIKMWREYFERATIVGADVQPECRQFGGGGIEIEIIDQSNVAHLVELCRKHGPFDIVIDDGSHIWSHQITTLRYVLPHIKLGGVYIIEDLDTSYGTYVETYGKGDHVSTAAYLQKVTDYLVGDVALGSVVEPDRFIWTYARRIAYIVFSRRTAILQMKA